MPAGTGGGKKVAIQREEGIEEEIEYAHRPGEGGGGGGWQVPGEFAGMDEALACLRRGVASGGYDVPAMLLLPDPEAPLPDLSLDAIAPEALQVSLGDMSILHDDDDRPL